MQSPCKFCPKKGCGAYHDVCPDFATYKSGKAAEKAHLKANGATFTDADAVTLAGAHRMQKVNNQTRRR